MTTDTGDTNSCNPCTKLELSTIFLAELPVRGSAINGDRKDGRKNRQTAVLILNAHPFMGRNHKSTKSQLHSTLYSMYSAYLRHSTVKLNLNLKLQS